MNGLQIFENPEFGQIRTLTEPDGAVLFCGSDVAKALGYFNAPDALAKHCRYIAKRDTPHPQAPDKTIELSFIPESDIYRLVFRSKLPGAEKFTDWVTEEVLPSIRKHGAYMTPETLEKAMLNPDFLLKLAQRLKEEQERSKRLRDLAALQEVEISIMQPKADYFDALVEKNLLTSLRETAKLLNIGEKDLIYWLTCKGYLYRAKGGKLLPTAERAKEGLFAVKEVRDKERNWFGVQTYVTPKGRETLRLLCERARENVERVLAEYDHRKKAE